MPVALLLIVVWVAGYAGPALGQMSLCVKHLESLSPDSNPWAGVAYNAPPPAAQKEGTRNYRGPTDVFYQLPTNEADYRAIFGSSRTMSPTVLEDVREGRHGLQIVNLPDARRDVTAENFDEKVKAVQGAFIILIGHNDNGNFVFVNGSKRDISDLANTCGASGKLCIFIACRSQESILAGAALGLRHEVTFAEGTEIAKTVMAVLTRNAATGMSAEELTNYLRQTERKAHFRYQTKYLIFKGCGAALGLMVIALVSYGFDDCKGKATPCRGR